MRQARGFTLIELAISLAIIALMLGMLLVPLNAQIDQQRINDTQKLLATISEAIQGFAVASGRLPCPATATTDNHTPGAGMENRAGTVCGITEGVLPWATLGMPELDSWGRRFTYRVTPSFADDPSGGLQSSFLLSDNGNITITSAGGAVTIAANVTAVVVSHGKNGNGGYLPSGLRMALGTGDELENADADASFVSKVPDPNFDDLLVWVTSSVLKSRMVAANRLP